MKKTLLLTIFALGIFLTVQAQENTTIPRSSIGISIGALGNYYYGPGDRNLGDFENNRLNYQLSGMLGITLSRDKNDHRTMLAGFGTFGLNNDKTISNILADQNYTTSATTQSNKNNLYLLEGGLLIAEVFRISTGIGQQNFDEQTLIASDGTIMTDQRSLKFNSTTVGFNFNLASVAITVNCNFASGKDFVRTVIIPSAGIMLRL